jgi:hypothetical protein
MAHSKHIKGDRAELIAAEHFISKNGWKVNRVPTKKQQELDVQLIFVNLDTREVYDAMPRKKDKQVETDTKNVVDIKEYMRTHMPE